MAAQPAADGAPEILEQTTDQAQVNGGGPPPPHRIRRTRMGGLWVAGRSATCTERAPLLLLSRSN
jgi:hypothetical protein